MNKTTNYSDFWMHDDDWDLIGESDDSNSSLGYNKPKDDSTHKMIRLSSARRAISNYVSILTGKNYPVIFNDGNMNCTDGQTVYISADITKKNNFDVAVGLSLHEGSHIKYSDMDSFKTIWMNVPRKIYDITEKLNISKDYVGGVCKDVYNYVEDRFIDYTVHKNAPGYRGYYEALYNKYFNNKDVTDALKSKMYRNPSVESYLFRLINLTNSSTDLKALPGLYDIAKILELKNINRLIKPMDRIEVAFDIVEVIFKNLVEIPKEEDEFNMDSFSQGGCSENFEGENSEGENEESNSQSGSLSETSDGDGNGEPNESVDDMLGGQETSVTSSDDDAEEKIKNDVGEDDKFPKSKINRIKKSYDKQKSFLRGELKKKRVTKKENKLLTVLEKSKVEVINVAHDYVKNSIGFDGQSIECILVKNLTKELLESGDCPLYIGSNNTYTASKNLDAINAGISMGIKIAHKLQIRNEINVTKFSRRYDGKLDRRLIHELGYNDDNIFYNTITEKYKNVHFHISVDASSSMHGEKWYKSISLCVAIAKAATQLDNVDVTISFRTVSNKFPYISVAYNSKVDKFSKIRNLFQYISPCATTPEGLCFEAILKYLPKHSSDTNSYFVNISDGEPYFSTTSTNNLHIDYSGLDAAYHTRSQVKKIKNAGYEVISYFVNDYDYGNSSRGNFKIMYGDDSNFINVSNINQIANTLNKKMMESLDI